MYSICMGNSIHATASELRDKRWDYTTVDVPCPMTVTVSVALIKTMVSNDHRVSVYSLYKNRDIMQHALYVMAKHMRDSSEGSLP